LKIKEITQLSASAYLMPDFLSWGKVLFSLMGGSLEPLVKEESEELLAKLKLLFEKVLVQCLAYLKLLVEEEVGLPLLWLGFLLGQ
jgi:hypothetical protein